MTALYVATASDPPAPERAPRVLGFPGVPEAQPAGDLAATRPPLGGPGSAAQLPVPVPQSGSLVVRDDFVGSPAPVVVMRARILEPEDRRARLIDLFLSPREYRAARRQDARREERLNRAETTAAELRDRLGKLLRGEESGELLVTAALTLDQLNQEVAVLREAGVAPAENDRYVAVAAAVGNIAMGLEQARAREGAREAALAANRARAESALARLDSATLNDLRGKAMEAITAGVRFLPRMGATSACSPSDAVAQLAAREGVNAALRDGAAVSLTTIEDFRAWYDSTLGRQLAQREILERDGVVLLDALERACKGGLAAAANISSSWEYLNRISSSVALQQLEQGKYVYFFQRQTNGGAAESKRVSSLAELRAWLKNGGHLSAPQAATQAAPQPK